MSTKAKAFDDEDDFPYGEAVRRGTPKNSQSLSSQLFKRSAPKKDPAERILDLLETKRRAHQRIRLNLK